MDATDTNFQNISSLSLGEKAIFLTCPILFLIVAFQASSMLLVFYSLTISYINRQFRRIYRSGSRHATAKKLRRVRATTSVAAVLAIVEV